MSNISFLHLEHHPREHSRQPFQQQRDHVSIRVQTQLKSRYPVFDATGKLPFDLVFGLRRKSDSDPRDISFRTSHSFLDVPYALAKGLLRIHELRRPSDDTKGPDERVEVDLSALRDATIADAGDESVVFEHIVLPSKSNKTEKRGQLGVTEYRYRVEARSPLTSCFEVGKKYSIGLSNRDLGTHRWINSSNPPSSDTIPTLTPTSESTNMETCNLISNAHGGFAVFTVVEKLTWAPPISTRMHLLLPKPSTTNSEHPSSNQISLDQPILRITVTNPHPTTPISLQTLGQQRFLEPWGPFQPESDDGLNPGKRPTILAPSSSAGTANLQIINLATGAVVRASSKPGVCSLTAGRPDLRPNVEDLVVLQPGVEVVREIGLAGLVRGLEDGRYVIRLNPKGCWWCSGEVAESGPDDGGKVPNRVYRAAKHQIAAVLQSEDEVQFILEDDGIVQG